MERQDWLDWHMDDAVGVLAGRRSGRSTGVRDLLILAQLCESMGRRIDRDMADGLARPIKTYPNLLAELDATGRLGAVSRKRIDAAHDLQLAGAILVAESFVFGDLQPPAGVNVTSWIMSTSLPTSTPGVTVHPDGTRTRSFLVCAAVGGEGPLAYNLPILIEPARAPTDVTRLALQALDVGRRGRALLRRYAPRVGHVNVGSLPLLLGRIRPAGPHPVLGGIFGDPVAFGDLPEVLDVLVDLADDDVPFVVQAAYSGDGRLEAPDGWWLDLTPRAPADAERPGGIAGVGGKIRKEIPRHLLGGSARFSEQALLRVPDVAGHAWVTRGSLVTQGTCGSLAFTAVGHVSSSGRPSIGITNLPLNERGLMRLSLGLEGLFGSAEARAACRRRVAGMMARVDVPTTSVPAARRIGGILVMAYRGTVLDRVGALPR